MSIKSTIRTALTNKKINSLLDSGNFDNACVLISKSYKQQAEFFKSMGNVLDDPETLKKTLKSIHKNNKAEITNIAMTAVDAFETIKKNSKSMLKNIKSDEHVMSFADKVADIFKKMV